VRRVLSPEFILVFLGAVGYAVWMGYYTILNHRHFTTMAFDRVVQQHVLQRPARASFP
jgi:hypothetical protein